MSFFGVLFQLFCLFTNLIPVAEEILFNFIASLIKNGQEYWGKKKKADISMLKSVYL